MGPTTALRPTASSAAEMSATPPPPSAVPRPSTPRRPSTRHASRSKPAFHRRISPEVRRCRRRAPATVSRSASRSDDSPVSRSSVERLDGASVVTGMLPTRVHAARIPRMISEVPPAIVSWMHERHKNSKGLPATSASRSPRSNGLERSAATASCRAACSVLPMRLHPCRQRHR